MPRCAASSRGRKPSLFYVRRICLKCSSVIIDLTYVIVLMHADSPSPDCSDAFVMMQCRVRLGSSDTKISHNFQNPTRIKHSHQTPSIVGNIYGSREQTLRLNMLQKVMLFVNDSPPRIDKVDVGVHVEFNIVCAMLPSLFPSRNSVNIYLSIRIYSLYESCYRTYIHVHKECRSVLLKLHPITIYRTVFEVHGSCVECHVCLLWLTNCVLLYEK